VWHGLLAWSAVASSAPIPPRWVLIYAAAPPRYSYFPHYTIDDFTRLVAVVDTAGRARAWLTTGAIFLQLYAPSANVFTDWIGGPPATGADWRAYADSIFAAGGPLERLDSAVARISAAVGPLRRPYRVAIMVPYPATVDTLRYGGQLYRLGDGASGAALAATYVADVAARFAQRGFRYLTLDGFYWLHETMDRRDADVVPRLAQRVHQSGFRLLWIPYFGANGWADWRRSGFDEAWVQPNYFFDLSLPTLRVDSAFARARARDMGVEIEFDGRLIGAPQYSARLFPYLGRLEAAADLRARSLAIYEGGGALLSLSRSRNPWHRAVYDRLVRALRAPDSVAVR